MIQRRSNLKVKSINYIDLEFNREPAIRGRGFIPTPFVNHYILNIQNEDDYCALYCIDAGLNPIDSKQHPQRPSCYDISKFNIDGIEFPLCVHDFTKLEKLNDNLKFVCNVFGYDKEDGISILRLAKDEYGRIPDGYEVINLLVFDSSEHPNEHYTLIRNLNAMLNFYYKTKGYKYCYNCLSGFERECTLEKHMELCLSSEGTRLVMPDKNPYCTFKNYNRQIKHPDVLYFDFESFQYPEDGDPKKCRHRPSGYALYNSFSKTLYSKTVDTGETDTLKASNDLLDHFIQTLQEQVMEYVRNDNKPMIISAEEKIKHIEAKVCYICRKPFGIFTKDKNHPDYQMHKVKDHCHVTGKYRGAAHSKCNLNLQTPEFIPILAHNLCGYDLHLFIEKLCSQREDLFELIPENDNIAEVGIIPKSSEKYSSISVKYLKSSKLYKNEKKESWCVITNMLHLRFLDSFAFLPSKLEVLVKNLKGDLPIMTSYMKAQNYTDEQIELIKLKGIFPYDWLDDIARLKEESLPPKIRFYSKLYNEDPNDNKLHKTKDEEYERAIKVWDTFKMKTMEEYHDLYLKCDTLQLADIFETFRDVAIENYGLDPAYYYSTPNYAWDCLLKNTRKVNNRVGI